MSQTKVRVNNTRPATRRGRRGGFQGQTNDSFPINSEEQRVCREEHNKTSMKDGNKSAFKRARGKAHKKTRNDNSRLSNLENDQEPGFGYNINTKLDGNKNRAFNKQGGTNNHQQTRNDRSMSVNNEQQRAVDYVRKDVNQKGKTFNTAGDQSSQSNGRSYESPIWQQCSGFSMSSSRAQTASNSSIQNSPLVQRNVPKPPIHSQNPLFVHGIMHRFNSMLPPSPLLFPENPQEISDEDNLKSGDEARVSLNVDEVFSYFQNPRQPFNPKLPNNNKKDNCSKELNPFQSKVSDNIRADFQHANRQSASQGGRDPELKSGPSGYVNRSPNIASTAVNGRTEILKSSGDAANNSSRSKTNGHQSQPSEYSLGAVLFAQIDEFKSKNKLQYEQSNTQTPLEHRSSYTPPCRTIIPGLMDNNSASSSNTNDFQHKNMLGNLSSENALQSEKPNPSNQDPSCNDITQSSICSKMDKRDLILKQFGFEGRPSSQNKDFNQSKQQLKSSTGTTLPKRSQSNQTVTSSKSDVESTSLPQSPCYNQDKQATFKGDSVLQTQAPQLQMKSSTQQFSNVDKNNSKCFITRSNNTSTQSGSNLTSKKLTGGNVYNIHQPARQSNQRPITREQSIRRFENQYAEKLVEHQIKEQEKAAKKREERLARYKHVDQGFKLNEGYLDEAVGGHAYIESEEDIRQQQQEQLRRDALVYQELERKKNEERIKREEEKKKQLLEKYKHVSSGQRLGGSNTEANILSEEEIRQQQQEQLRKNALAYQEEQKKKNEERIRREEEKRKQELEKYKNVSSGQRLGGSKTEAMCIESEEKNEIQQIQLDQLRRDALAYQEDKRKKNEDRIRREEEQKKLELNKCKQMSSDQRLDGSNNEGSSEDKKRKKEYSSQETEPADITSLLEQFLKTSGIVKTHANGETEEILSQFKSFMANTKKAPDTQAISLQPAQIETPVASDSQNLSKKPASCTLASTTKGPVLVIRPTQEALDHTISQSRAVQDMDKHGQSSLYKAQIEQTPKWFNNKFQWKQPECSNRYQQHSLSETSLNNVDQSKSLSKMDETKNVQKSLDEIARLTGAIPKQRPMVKDTNPPNCSSTLSSEPACSEVMEIDLQEEMRAARLRMQERYDKALRKQQDN